MNDRAGKTMPDEAALLALLCDCLRFDARPETSLGLAGRVAAVGWSELLDFAGTIRLSSALVHAAERLKLAPAMPAVTLPDGRMTVPRMLQKAAEDFRNRRQVFSERLGEIAVALNAVGIVPVALKGAASLVSGKPEWRYLRDLDLLVVGAKAARAQAILEEIGYRPAVDGTARFLGHHLKELYRADMPGWIEIHRRAGLTRVEQFVPSLELIAAARLDPEALVKGVAALPPHLDALNGMAHHHLGHKGGVRAKIDPKGLYEFAAALLAMSGADREALAKRAARHPRLLAILDLWIAAAADRFGMEVTAPFTLTADAAEWWARIRDGDRLAWGMRLELRAATDPDRMRRTTGGGSTARRAWWRASVPFTFFRRQMLMPQFRVEEGANRPGQAP